MYYIAHRTVEGSRNINSIGAYKFKGSQQFHNYTWQSGPGLAGRNGNHLALLDTILKQQNRKNYSENKLSNFKSSTLGQAVFLINQRTKRKFPQLCILSQIWDLKSPIGDNISDKRLGINESGKAESENNSPIPNWKISPIGDLKKNILKFSDWFHHVHKVP